MTAADKPVEPEHVACEVCLNEVPKSEATVPEATDYFTFFCGLDCCEKMEEASGGNRCCDAGIQVVSAGSPMGPLL